MEFWRWFVLIIIFSEIVLYFIGYWKFIPAKKNSYLMNKLYDYGISLFKETVRCNHSQDEVISFVQGNITPYKIIDDRLFMRRKYLKWIMWATPVPLKSVIVFREQDKNCLLEVRLKTLIFPCLAVLSPIIIAVVSDEIDMVTAILSSVLGTLLMYLMALVEKAALMTKIYKISNIDSSYTMFA